MTISPDKEKYEDVTIYFTDYSGLDDTKIKFYLVSSTDQKTEIPASSNFLKIKQINKTLNNRVVQLKYIVSNEYLNKKKKRFYVSVTDNSGKYFRSYFRITANGVRYGVDYAPRIQKWSASGNTVLFVARDLGGTKQLLLYDMNDNGTKKVEKADIGKGDVTVSFNISEFKQVNGKYKIKIYAKDVGSSNIAASRLVEFSIDATGSNNTSSNNENNQTSKEDTQATVEETGTSNTTVNTKITKIELDRTVLMLDKDHYNFAELTAKLTPNKTAKIQWSSSNTSVATVNQSGKVKGKKYGTAKITATVKNDDGTSIKATCKVRVISNAEDSSVGKKYTYENTFYLVEDKWTDAEVESYINNAAMLLKKYPNKYEEGKKINVFYYYGGTPINSFIQPSVGDSRLYTYPYGRSQQNIIKPKGQLDINGYVLFFSTKKQWIYLLKKDSKGTFKMVKKERSSGGPNYESEFNTFLAGIHTSTELGQNNKTDMHAIYRMGAGGNSLYANSVHLRRHSRIPNKSWMYTYNSRNAKCN